METTQVPLNKGINKHIIVCHSVEWWVVQEAVNFGFKKSSSMYLSLPDKRVHIISFYCYKILENENWSVTQNSCECSESFSMAVIKHQDQKQFVEKNIYLVLDSRGISVSHSLDAWQ